MVESTSLTLHMGYGCYLRQFSFPLFHILLSPSSPSMANSKPTTVNTTNNHKTKQNKTKQNKKKIQSTAMPTKRKIFPIINTTTNHTNPPPSQPKLQTITTIIENPNTPTKNLQIGDPKLPTQTHKHIHTKKNPKPKPKPNPRILRLKTKIMKMRSGFLFLVYIYVWMNW